MRSEIKDGKLLVEGLDRPIESAAGRVLWINVDAIEILQYFDLDDDTKEMVRTHEISGRGTLAEHQKLKIAGTKIESNETSFSMTTARESELDTREWIAYVYHAGDYYDDVFVPHFRISANFPEQVIEEIKGVVLNPSLLKFTVGLDPTGLWGKWSDEFLLRPNDEGNAGRGLHLLRINYLRWELGGVASQEFKKKLLISNSVQPVEPELPKKKGWFG